MDERRATNVGKPNCEFFYFDFELACIAAVCFNACPFCTHPMMVPKGISRAHDTAAVAVQQVALPRLSVVVHSCNSACSLRSGGGALLLSLPPLFFEYLR